MLSRKKALNTRANLQKTSDDQSGCSIAAEQALAKVKAFAHTCFDKASGSHDWDHTLRVFRLCEMLGPAENADMDVLGAAAFLHDIGRDFQDASNGAICHAEKGAQMMYLGPPPTCTISGVIFRMLPTARFAMRKKVPKWQDRWSQRFRFQKNKSKISFTVYPPIAFVITTNRPQPKQRCCLMPTNWMPSAP
jgi:uncharacterized protein